MKHAGEIFLEGRARRNMFATYDEFWSAVRRQVGDRAGNPWRQIPQLLRQIGEDSIRDTGLALGAIVVADEPDPHPSEGFFRLAAREGILAESEAPDPGAEWNRMTRPQREFWQDQVTRIFGRYGLPE